VLAIDPLLSRYSRSVHTRTLGLPGDVRTPKDSSWYAIFKRNDRITAARWCRPMKEAELIEQ
jgi:hypothetical protein